MEKNRGTEEQVSLRFSKVDLMTYRKFQVRVETNKILEPSLSVRLLSEPLVNEVERELSRNGYLSSVGMLSVALKKDESWNASDIDEIRKKILSGEELTEKVWLVDGRHRLTAMKRMMSAKTNWKESLAVVTVTLWGPPEGDFLSMSELISLGCQLNRSSSTVRAHTFQDQVHAAVSFAATLRESPQVVGSKRKLTSVNLAEALNHSGILSHVDVRQRQRYAQVACRLSESKESFNMFLKQCEICPKLSLVHVSHDALLRNKSDGQFALGLRAVTSKVDNEIQGSFQDMRKGFYLFFNEVLGLLDNICQYEAVGFEDLLQKIVPITKHESCTVSKLVERSMGRFTAVGMQEVSNDRRMRSIRKHLAKIVKVDNPAPREDPTLRESVSVAESVAVAPVLQSNRDVSSEASSIPMPTVPDGPEEEDLDGRPSPPVAANSRVRTPPQRAAKRSPPVRAVPRVQTPPQRKRTAQRPLARSLSFRSSDGSKKRAISLERPGKSSSKRRRVTGRGGTKSSKSPSLSNDDYSGMEEDADDGGVIDAGNSLFDDAIPELLPIGTQDPPAEEEGTVDAPVRLVVALPSAWNDAVLLLSQHVAKFLRAMFIPPEHRANVFLRDMKGLRANHSMIYMRAAFNYYMRHPHELPDPWMGASGLKREVWRQVGHLTAKHTAVAMAYFGRAREELYQKGFCILEGFVADETVPDEEVSQIDANTVRFFRKLHSAIEETFPGEKALRGGKGKAHKSGWNYIINQTAVSDHKAHSKNGAGRYTMSNAAMAVFEQDEDRAWMARARALLDVRIGQAMAALGVWDNRDAGLEQMFTPKSGGRWLYTSKGCMRQTLHTDFPLLEKDVEGNFGRPNPGFFTITTGPQEVPLWVCPFSQHIVSWSDEGNLVGMSKGMKVVRVLIPPFSMFVGRGDMFHCGAGFDDYPGDSGLLRYHLYFVPESVSLPDGVHLLCEFQPTFQYEEHEEFEGYDSGCGNGSEKIDLVVVVEEEKNEEEEWEDAGAEQARGQLLSLQALSEEEEQTFQELLRSGGANENTHLHISKEDLQQLDGCNHLGDNILNRMFDMINRRNTAHFSSLVPCSDESSLVGSTVLHEGPRPRLHVMDTQFSTRLRRQKGSERYDYSGVKGALSRAGLSIATFDTIVVPIFMSSIEHWTVAVVDFRRKKLFYIDSLRQRDHENTLPCIRRWVQDEVRDKGLLDASVQGVEEWGCVVNPPYVPTQEDHHACGIFVLYYIYFLELGIKPEFTHGDVRTLRVRTGLYLKQGKIPPSEWMTVE